MQTTYFSWPIFSTLVTSLGNNDHYQWQPNTEELGESASQRKDFMRESDVETRTESERNSFKILQSFWSWKKKTAGDVTLKTH